jgi:hypothetical protein
LLTAFGDEQIGEHHAEGEGNKRSVVFELVTGRDLPPVGLLRLGGLVLVGSHNQLSRVAGAAGRGSDLA